MKLWKGCLSALCAILLVGVTGTADNGSAPVEAMRASSHLDGVPLLSRVTVSSPDSAGMVAIAGAAGAVPPGSNLFLSTLDTGHWTTVRAAADGRFTTSLPAVAGASILIKSEAARRWRSPGTPAISGSSGRTTSRSSSRC